MNILIVPEDSRKDKYILKPLFERLFRSLGKSNAHVRICEDPILGGIAEALKSANLALIVERYRGMADCFILCVDCDGETGRLDRLDQIEADFESERLLAENAWEELETWVLAGLELPSQWRWSEVRAEVSVKERYFDDIARRRGLADLPDGGRRTLADEASQRINVIRQKCPEDFDNLARRIARAT